MRLLRKGKVWTKYCRRVQGKEDPVGAISTWLRVLIKVRGKHFAPKGHMVTLSCIKACNTAREHTLVSMLPNLMVNKLTGQRATPHSGGIAHAAPYLLEWTIAISPPLMAPWLRSRRADRLQWGVVRRLTGASCKWHLRIRMVSVHREVLWLSLRHASQSQDLVMQWAGQSISPLIWTKSAT